MNLVRALKSNAQSPAQSLEAEGLQGDCMARSAHGGPVPYFEGGHRALHSADASFSTGPTRGPHGPASAEHVLPLRYRLAT